MSKKPPSRITEAVEQLTNALVHATTAMNLADDADMALPALLDARWMADKARANLTEAIDSIATRKFPTKARKARK